QVAEHPARDIHRRLFADDLGGAALEAVHRRVLAVLVVADLGVGHRAAHRRRGQREGVTAELDRLSCGHLPMASSSLANAATASAIAVKPSRTLLTVKRVASPASPFWIDPRNVSGPTQKTIDAVTNPSATVLVVPRAKRRCSASPSWLSRASTPMSEPMIPP